MFGNDTLRTARTPEGTTSSAFQPDTLARRRRVIEAIETLESRPGDVTVDRLVDALITPDATGDDRRRLRIRLHHIDLPWLEDHEEIVHHAARGTVSRLES